MKETTSDGKGTTMEKLGKYLLRLHEFVLCTLSRLNGRVRLGERENEASQEDVWLYLKRCC